MKLGAENRKSVIALGGLTLVLGYFFYSNVIATDSPQAPASQSAKAVAPPPTIPRPTGATSEKPAPPRPGGRTRSDEFHPVLHPKRAEDRVDPMQVDPTLRLDLLAKLQEVPPAGAGRNLFTVGAPPVVAQLPSKPEPVMRPHMGPRPLPEPPGPPGPPPPRPLPPITFKYYGFSTVRKDGKKAAFFLAGDEIMIKAPGDMVNGSYKLVSIGLTSAVVEDTESKRTQTVPLAEEAQG